MEYRDFVNIIEERLGGEFSGARATITAIETYDEKTKEEGDRIIAVEYKTRFFRHPKLYIYVNDTSYPKDSNGFFPVVGIEGDNPKITQRNAKNISTRCGNAFRKYLIDRQLQGVS